MKAILVMFDSLNRRMLPPYGCDWVHAPNFRRLAEKTVRFDNCFVGSMPCMPARREIHTGRYDFLHRGWGPLEPFDESMPEILKRSGIHSHLASDHYHYWEDGGANYHCRYSTWEFFRGQEGDPWKADLADRSIPDTNGRRHGAWVRQDFTNRKYMPRIEDHYQYKTFSAGVEFLRRNHGVDGWFLQIETFDPHEPYFTHRKYKDLYAHDYAGPTYDWPPYGAVREPEEVARHLRCEYAALVSLCDEQLGRVLDLMDRYDLWDDTLLIVNTDHGFFLGEHGFWGKCFMPFYNEVARIPLFIWDPRSRQAGRSRKALVQTIDLAPTLLDFFRLEIPSTMEGKPLREAIASDRPVREAGLFGMFGSHVNVTDGRHVYMRAPIRPDGQPLFQYSLMPGLMKSRERVEDLRNADLAGPFSFTKGCRVLKFPRPPLEEAHDYGHLLFDLENDPSQETPINDEKLEQAMIEKLVALMKANEAPEEQFQRLGLA